MSFRLFMLLPLIMAVAGIYDGHAQAIPLEHPSQVREVLNTLQGEFKWKMIRPSENKILRTGTRISDYYLDSLILVSHEQFNDSNIKQIAFFGYNPNDSTFFTVELFNIDIGPHISIGNFSRDWKKIIFTENDSSEFHLNIVNHSKHFWIYRIKRDQIWEERDLTVVFERK